MNILITGGAGFIGSNVAWHHLTRGDRVTVFDNLGRPGSERNLAWLQSHDAAPASLQFIQGDIRDTAAITSAVTDRLDLVYHFAGQVAVTTSVKDPRTDFEVNAAGAFNLLEAVRTRAPQSALFYASTNKVYGALEGISVVESDFRYALPDYPHGIPETQPVDFHSPYGCSKGAADQYIHDYARLYGLKTVVFRQSCVYGIRQFGVEDQGWVAHFCIAALLNRPITIYGNGKQVRDLLWIGDLIELYDAAYKHIGRSAGQIYNAGGGPEHTMSIWAEFRGVLSDLSGRSMTVRFQDGRPGDQRFYVSDVRKAEADLGWRPRTDIDAGMAKLWAWLQANRQYFE